MNFSFQLGKFGVNWGNVKQNLDAWVKRQGIQFFEHNNKVQWEAVDSTIDKRLAFEACTPLAGMIVDMAEKFSNAKVFIVDEDGEKVDSDITKLLYNPNEFQTQKTFLKTLYAYTKINGWAVILKEYPAGVRDVPENIYVLPYWCVEVDTANNNFNPTDIESIKDSLYFTYTNEKGSLVKEKLNPKDIILITDSTGDLDDYTYLPKSRISLAKYPISQYLSASEADLTLIQNRGAIGIISSNSPNDARNVPMTTNEKDELQEAMDGYGLSRDKKQFILTKSNITYTPIAFNNGELRIHEGQIMAIKAMSFIMSYPFILTPYSDQSTYNNVETAKRDMYSDVIIPNASGIAEQLESGLGIDTDVYDLEFDYEHVAALQESEETKAQAMKAKADAFKAMYELGLVTRNQILEKMGEEPVNEEGFDTYYFQNEEADTQQDDNGGEPQQ